jgi:single-stranded-DNA-specific exonuclease
MDQHNAIKTIKRRVIDKQDMALSPDVHPVLNRIYRCRNITNPAELDNSFSQLLSPDKLKGIDSAVELIYENIKLNKNILIVADYDADGATSCAVVIRALRGFGANNVSYIVPDRFKYGYGLTPEIVKLAKDHSPDLIITVDNGIASNEGVQAARDAGIQVLITDHHLPGKEIPVANAIVNPNQPGCTFPSKSLAGVGVIFYTMIALRAYLRKVDWFTENSIPDFNLSELTDIVALGTVADLVQLDHNNRVLVAQGMARINRGNAHVGIKALLAISNRAAGKIKTSDLGFYVAPRINAAGRLENMALGVECLLTDDPERAAVIANKLDQINNERRAIQKKMQEQALQIVQSLPVTESSLPSGFCLFDQTWHQGVIGLVASKVKERYHRPVIAFAPGDNGEIKGSARSVTGLHIRDVLDEIATSHPAILQKFGGHAMAAGLSIKHEHLDEFTSLFELQVANSLSAENLQAVIHSDGELDSSCLTDDFADMVNTAAPWGQGFEAPVFDNMFDVIESKIVGEHHLKLKLKLPYTGESSHNDSGVIDAIAFNQNYYLENSLPEKIRAAYKLDINEYRGWRSLQLIVEYIEH